MNPKTLKKSSLTLTVILFVIMIGITFQWQYNQRRLVYTEKITGFYRTHLKREPDAIGLKHWVTWALNNWPIDKVERLGFIKVAEEGLD